MTLQEETQRFGVLMFQPEIHRSGLRHDLERDTRGRWGICKALAAIIDLSADGAHWIVWECLERPFTSVFLKTYNLASSSAHRAVEGLLERDLIDREGEGYIISDRFFRLWIER